MIQFLNNNSDLCITITSIGTVIISTLAFLVSIYVAISQNRFNKNSVRPICDISCIDYTNHIRIELINNGLGIMIIKKVQFKDIDDRTENSIINFLPENIRLSHYIRETSGRTLIQGGKIVLLDLKSDNYVNIEELRNILSKLTVIVQFTNVYNKKFVKKRNLHEIYATVCRRQSNIILQ